MIASLEALAREQAAATPSAHTVFSARLESLWRRLQREFSDRQSRRQMAWERQDGIWQQDAPLVNAAVLAERYARATRAGLADQARQLAATREADQETWSRCAICTTAPGTWTRVCPAGTTP